MLFVREAVICLDCDLIYSQHGNDNCPNCFNSKSIKLRDYFPAKEIITRRIIDDMINSNSTINAGIVFCPEVKEKKLLPLDYIAKRFCSIFKRSNL